jgi:aminoglycoside phosphotransferase (APT) family kinase protein
MTVTHGDMRLDNILFYEDGKLAALIDWQTCSLGNPANDVAYLIGTSFADPADRRQYEEKLVQDYLDRRDEEWGMPFDFDAFWQEYRRHAFSGFIMAINASLHVEQTERGDRMFAAMAERPAQMALDLDSLNLL